MVNIKLSLTKLNSLTLQEKQEFAESIGCPELLKDFDKPEIDIETFESLEEGVGSFTWTDVYSSAMKKLWN